MKLPSMLRGVRANVLGKSAAFSLCAILVAAGCSGGGSSGSGSPDQSQNVSVGGPDVHGDSFSDATIVRLGDGIVQSHINTPGDLDFFEFQLTGGSLYGLQFAGFPGSEVVNPNDNDLQYFLIDGAGNEIETQFGLLPYPAGVDSVAEDSNPRDAFIAPFTGKYFLRFSGEFANSIGAYDFRLTSSRLGVTFGRGDVDSGGPQFGGTVTNFRSYVLIRHPEGELAFEGPTPFNAGGPTDALGAVLNQGGIQFTGVSDEGTPPRFSLAVEVFEPGAGATHGDIFFRQTSGDLEEDPESPALHIHFGIPSQDLSDGIDDIDWSSGTPVDDFRQDINMQDLPDAHPIVADITEGAEGVGEDVLHLIMSQDWYIDWHFTNKLDLYNIPIVSSHPQNGFRFFDSAFELNGFETVPPTGSTRELEVVYNDEYQVFYLPYGLDSALAGSPIHIHSGGPGEEGPVLIDLGTVPGPATRPVLESFRLGEPNFVPGVENVIKRLTNTESKLLHNASFAGGWYLDVHTEPFFVVKPEIRADMNFATNFEVATSLVSFSSEDERVVGDDKSTAFTLAKQPQEGTVTFVTETTEYGDIQAVLNGEILGSIANVASPDDVACGESVDGAAVVGEILPGTYYYRAFGDGVMWDGHVTVDEGGCTTIVLDAASAQQQ